MRDVLWVLSRHCDELQGLDWRNPTRVVCSVDPGRPTTTPVFTPAELDMARSSHAFGLVSDTANLAPMERILSDRSTPPVHFLAVVDACPTSHAPFRSVLLRALRRESMAVLVSRPSTAECLRKLFDAARREVFRVQRIPDVPDWPTPAFAEQRGNLLLLGYDADTTGSELLHAVLEAYAVPWMGDSIAPRGLVPAAVRRWVAAGAGAMVGFAAAYFATRQRGNQGATQ